MLTLADRAYSGICLGGGKVLNFFLYSGGRGGGVQNPLGTWKLHEIHRFHRSTGLSPLSPSPLNTPLLAEDDIYDFKSKSVIFFITLLLNFSKGTGGIISSELYSLFDSQRYHLNLCLSLSLLKCRITWNYVYCYAFMPFLFMEIILFSDHRIHDYNIFYNAL